MIVVNYKTYEQATASYAVTISKMCKIVQETTHVPVIPAVQAADIWRNVHEVGSTVWTQHVDASEQGTNTGFITIESIIQSGATGTILNHSEHQLDLEILEKTVARIRQADASFKILICVRDIESLKQTVSLKPDYIAFEPPELIGSKTDSVATKYADFINDAVNAANGIPLLVGAGIKDVSDVRVSLEKGAKGILISSAVVTADNPESVLSQLAEAFAFYLKKQSY